MRQKITLLLFAFLVVVLSNSVTAAVGEYNANAFLNVSGNNVSSVLADTNAIDSLDLRFNESANSSVNGTYVWHNATFTQPYYLVRDDWSKWDNQTRLLTPPFASGRINNYVRVFSSAAYGQTILATRDAGNIIQISIFNATTMIWSKNVSSSATQAVNNLEIVAENVSGRVMILFTNATATNWIRYMIWNGTNMSVNSSVRLFGGASYAFVQMRVVAQPRSNELIGLFETTTTSGAPTTPDLYFAHWTGSAWDNITSLDNGTEQALAKDFDIAYEEVSGDGLMVWGNFSNSSTISRTFTNTTSDSKQRALGPEIPAYCTGLVCTGTYNYFRLAPDKGNSTSVGSDRIMACDGSDTASATSYDIYCSQWNGTAWQANTTSIDITAEGGTRTTGRNFDLTNDPTTGGFIVAETPNGQDFPKLWRCMNHTACQSGIATYWENYNTIFSVVDQDSIWVQLHTNPLSEGKFVVLVKEQVSFIQYHGNFTCTSSTGSCSGTAGNLFNRGASTAAALKDFDFAFDMYSVMNSSIIFNSSATSGLGSATINYINVTIALNHTYANATYNMSLYNWTDGSWDSCNSAALYTNPSNAFTNFTCTVCFSGCNITSDPADFRSTSGGNSDQVVRFYLNRTTENSRGHPMTLNGTMEIDYIKFFIDYTATASLGFIIFTIGGTNVTATSTAPPNAVDSGGVMRFSCNSGTGGGGTTNGCTAYNISACRGLSGSTCQDDNNPFYIFYNTGGSSENWQLALNASLPSGITMFCDTDNNPNGAIVMSTSYQTLSTVTAGAAQNGWCWANFTGVYGTNNTRLHQIKSA